MLPDGESLTVNPYCQILENSSRNFSKIFIFRVVTQTVYLENSSNFFSKFQIWGRDPDRLPGKLIHWKIMSTYSVFLLNIGAWARPISGKLVHIWMNFPEIGLWHASEFFEYHFSTKCSILDEFSRNWPISCPKIIKLTIGWDFHKSVQLIPWEFANKG